MSDFLQKQKTKKPLSDERRQLLLIILCWVVYTGNYLARYGYNSNINGIIEHYGVDKSQAGLVATCFFFAYGAGQVINGILCSKYKLKIVMPLSLAVSSVLNLIAFFLPDFHYFKYMWLINGLTQSVSWPSLVLVLGRYLSKKNLKKAIISMSTTTAAGTLITYCLSALFNEIGMFNLSFLFGGVIIAVCAILWLTVFDKLAVECNDEEDEPTEQQAVQTDNGKSRTVALVMFIVLGLFAVIDNFVKDGLSTWVPTIMKDTYGFSDSLSIILSLVLPLVGIFGATLSIFLNSKIKDFVALCGVLFVASAVMLAFIIPDGMPFWVMLIVFGSVYCFMSSVNNAATSMAPLFLRNYFNSGKTAGLLNGCCYLGSTISSYGLGVIAARGGWNTVFAVLLGSAVFAALVCGIYLAVKPIITKKTK